MMKKWLTFGLSPEQEDRYRQFNLKSDTYRATVGIGVLIVPAFLFIFNDYQFFGLSPRFFGLAVLRGFLIAYSIWVLNYLRRAQHYRSYDKALFFWSLFLILVMLYIDSTRSKSFVMHLAPTLVVVFVFLLIIPNRLPSQIFLTLLVFTGESLIMAPKIRLSETLPLAFSILTASAMGIVSAGSSILRAGGNFWRERGSGAPPGTHADWNRAARIQEIS